VVSHDLTRLIARGAEAHAVHHRIQAAFQKLQQCLTGNALALIGFGVSLAELALEHTVDAANFLFFAQLRGIAGEPALLLSVLPGRIAAALHRTLVREALLALQKQLLALAPALPAF